MNPILTLSKDKKDANNAQRTTRKREETVLIESRLETSGGTTSIGRLPLPISRYSVILP